MRLPRISQLAESTVESAEESHLLEEISKCRVLIVDDHPDAADVLTQLLSIDEHEKRSVAEGLAALKIAHEFDPEIALLAQFDYWLNAEPVPL